MKATAIAPANIAFIKYWGKSDDALRLPLNSSISMNLSNTYTTTTVEFSSLLKEDVIEFINLDKSYQLKQLHDLVWSMDRFNDGEKERVVSHIDRIRAITQSHLFAKVVTQNNFPTGVGIASSASGFAALTVAAIAALELNLSEKELTILARLGSGSACRSIPDGFVVWNKGNSSQTSYAHSLYPSSYWDLRDIIAVVETKEKEISTSRGMDKIRMSPFWKERIEAIPKKILQTKKALEEKNFTKLGELIEEDCLNMHHVMQTQDPPLYYWNDTTRVLMETVADWRKEGIPVYFTIDAGPNVHLICEAMNEQVVVKKLKEISAIKQIIINNPARGAHLTGKHLF